MFSSSKLSFKFFKMIGTDYLVTLLILYKSATFFILSCMLDTC